MRLPPRTLIVAAAAAALAAAGIAAATIPSSSGTITGCYANTDGALRVIDSSASCSGTETRLTWSQNGPGAMIYGGVDFVDAQDTTGYIGLGGRSNVAPSAALADTPVPVSGSLRKLRVLAAPASGTVTFRVYRSGSSTTTTCQITAPKTGCSDLTHTQAFAAGQRISLQVANATNAGISSLRWSAQYP